MVIKQRGVIRAGNYMGKTTGMEFIEKMIRNLRWSRIAEETIPASRVVGAFGIKESDGFDNIIRWVVHPHRSDKRHGALEPAENCKYSDSLHKSMFKGWD